MMFTRIRFFWLLTLSLFLLFVSLDLKAEEWSTPVGMEGTVIATAHAETDKEWSTPVGMEGLALTALDRYVRTPDPHYRFELVNTIKAGPITGYLIDMISQQWLTEEEVDRPLWQHYLFIVVPQEVQTDTALLIVSGGSNGGAAPDKIPEIGVMLAQASKSVVAQVGMIPNQPLSFKPEDKPRKEDALISYTWNQYLRTGDERWPARLPMTKAVVRAMDTVTSFCASEEGGSLKIEKFAVAGGSKRGWTTWTTAAVDNRVVAISPIVIDMLNLVPSFIHHFEAYGRYAEAVDDYEHLDLMSWTQTEEYKHLLAIVEPYEYRKRLTLPKFILNSTGDQFFLPDSSQFYFADLEGEKYLRYVPNTDHGLDDSDALESLLAWYHAIAYNVPRPRFNWKVLEDGTIRVFTLTPPAEVRLWHATNPESRDFRKQTIGAAWTSEVLEPVEEGVYLGKMPLPEKGWTAYMVELTFPSGVSAPFKFTTDVVFTPKEMPFKYTPPDPTDHAPGFLHEQSE